MAKPFPGPMVRIILLSAALCMGSRASAAPAPQAAEISVSSAQVRRALAQAIEQGDRAAISTNVWLLARMGGSLSPGSRARIASLLGDSASALPADLNALFDANAVPASGSSLAWTVPVSFRLIEGIAFDPVRRRLFAGSVVDRRLLLHGPQGWTEVAVANLGGVFGMAVDNQRRTLWLATGPAEPVDATAAPFSGLVAVHLDRLAEVRRIAMPGASPGDVALARDGSLFVSDGRSGAVHLCRSGCTETRLLVAPGVLRSPQGMALWPDGRHLIVADYSQGLFRIEIATGAVAPVLPAQPAMLEGIDGLLLHRGRLIAIQNGGAPRRILAISLDREARAIIAIEVLERAHSGWGEPTLGTMNGETLIYVADAQWERFGAGGALQGEGPLRPTAIRALPITGTGQSRGGAVR